MPTDIDNAKYVSFTSYKKDGTPVSLPVWIVRFEDGYAFTTDPTSYKAKRIMRNPRVTLRVCDMRGRVADGVAEHEGTATVLLGADAERVVPFIKKKYPLGWSMLGAMSLMKKITRKGTTATAEAAIKVVLHS